MSVPPSRERERTGQTGGSLRRTSASKLAEAVRLGELRARQVVEESLGAIAEREPVLHCFNTVTSERALEAADALDRRIAGGADPGPLAGVPIALKDNLCTRGVATTCSSRILEGWRPPYDATVVERLAAAGAISVGKTNLDEFAMGSSTESSAFGPTRNPWDTGRVPGGSSGGSAAAVAAGFVPVALGSDTGGSIRQPAALCGAVGVKPTYGLVSRYGLVAFASSLDQVGPITSCVADAALVLEVIAGHDARDSTSLACGAPRLTEVLSRGADGLRVGIVEEFLASASASCSSAVEDAASALGAAGALIEPVKIPELMHALAAYYLIAPAEASSNLARYDGVRYGLRVEAGDVEQMSARSRAAGFGPEVKRRIMLGTYVLSAGYYDAYYAQAQRVRTIVARAFSSAYERFDLLLTPTTPSVAFPLGAKVDDPLEMYLSDLFTIPTNLAGHPAISVPFGTGEEGLPIGVQLLGPALSERELFRAAAALEAAAPVTTGPVTTGPVTTGPVTTGQSTAGPATAGTQPGPGPVPVPGSLAGRFEPGGRE